jgi:LuxR family maltose regulon positive regulatory protein
MSLATTLATVSPTHSHLLDDVARWVERCGLTAEDTLEYTFRFESLAMVRALVAIGQPQRALALAEPMAAACLASARNGDAIELLAIQAVALHLVGDAYAALETLVRALGLGEPEGYVRTVVDLGDPMRSLLSDMLAARREAHGAVAPNVSTAYIEQLLLAFPARDVIDRPRDSAHPAAAPLAPPAAALIEPLTEREIEVLRLMSQGLRNQEIAQALYVSINTVRFHTKNIYSKLLVNNRVQAVARATDLHLL